MAMDNCTGIINTHDSKYSAVTDLLDDPQNITGSFVDVGDEVNARGIKNIKFYVTLDINDSVNVRFKVLGKHTFDTGTEEYPLSSSLVTVHTNSTYTAAAASRYFEIDDDADQLLIVEVQTDNTIDGVQLQVSAGTAGASPGQIDALYCLRGA